MEFSSFNLGNYKKVDVNLDVGYPQKYHQFPQIELLSIVLEFLQLYIPNRSFQTSDLFANVTGVLIGYIMIKIFKIGRKNE